ncbi:dynein assembly factor 3, axonemal-like [Lytechinus variegatus]|uniref:dynein assembly factor 3, axonemal-like n=1 Tax=Lytechinus variegatus TaxID=7654 RepID=UPI001BB1AF24|nr:dynein assembly factor 3, axonemal-like [Lytechinus variegatus]
MVDSLGAITFWGFSSALDLQDKDLVSRIKDVSVNDGADDAIQILLIGSGDIRHLLTTVARAWRHRKRKLKFYIIEGNLELYIRQLLLLHLILEPPKDMGLQEKTEFFLEIYGNTLIRQQVFDYIVSRSNQLLRMVTDADYLVERMPSVHLSALKFKERDQMEAILKFLRNPDLRTADIAKFWDNRLRKHLEVRYDSRKGAYDWDYSMKLGDRGKGVLNNREYAYWRETGIAFGLREADYNIQNRTLISGLIIRKGGDRIAERGYWGDIVCSPYLSYGIECEEESFFKKSNGLYTKTSQEVAVYNILSLLHELTHKERYVMPVPKPAEEKKEESKLVEITEEDEEEEEEEKEEDGKVVEVEDGKAETETAELMSLDNVEIHYLPIGSAPDLQKKSKYKRAFDVVYFSNSMVHHLTPEMSAVFSDKATVICETARYMLELKKEQCQEFVNKVTAMAKNAGCQASNPVDGFTCSTMRFTFERKGDS